MQPTILIFPSLLYFSLSLSFSLSIGRFELYEGLEEVQ